MFMGIYGYKSFDHNGKNINGAVFEPGVVYTVPGKAHFGTHGNGYHFALRLEDTLSNHRISLKTSFTAKESAIR